MGLERGGQFTDSKGIFGDVLAAWLLIWRHMCRALFELFAAKAPAPCVSGMVPALPWESVWRSSLSVRMFIPPTSLAECVMVLSKNMIAVLIIGVISLTCAYSLSPGHPWGGDFSMYLMQKDSLKNKDMDTLLATSQFRMENSTFVVGPNVYPWGYPVVLCYLSQIFEDDLNTFMMANAVFLFGFLLCVYVYFKDSMHFSSMILLLCVLGLTPAFFEIKNSVLSDLLAVMLAYASLVACQMSLAGNRARVIMSSAICGVCMFLACMTRTQYVVLPVMVAVVQWYGMKQRGVLGGFVGSLKNIKIVHGIPYLVFLSCLILVQVFTDVKSSYGAQFEKYNVFTTLLYNAVYYAYALSLSWGVANLDPDLFRFSDPLPKIVSASLFLVFLPALVMGIKSSYRTRKVHIIVGLLGIAIPMFYPWQGGLRLVLFSVPFYIYFVLSGLEYFVQNRFLSAYQRIAKFVVMALVSFFIVTAAYKVYLYQGENYVIKEGPYTKDSVELWGYIKQNTDKDSTFAFWKPRVLSLFTGRKAAAYGQVAEIDTGRIDYLVLFRDADILNYSSCRSCPEKYDKVFSNRSYAVYRMKSERIQNAVSK